MDAHYGGANARSRMQQKCQQACTGILECRHNEDNITNMVRNSGSTVTLQPMTYWAKRHNTKMGTKALRARCMLWQMLAGHDPTPQGTAHTNIRQQKLQKMHEHDVTQNLAAMWRHWLTLPPLRPAQTTIPFEVVPKAPKNHKPTSDLPRGLKNKRLPRKQCRTEAGTLSAMYYRVNRSAHFSSAHAEDRS